VIDNPSPDLFSHAGRLDSQQTAKKRLWKPATEETEKKKQSTIPVE
jgi:hypothetical protein